jgi:hypothetical protein
MNDPATAWAETTGDLRAYGDATRLLRARLLGAGVTPRAGLAIWPAEGSESRRNRPAATRRGGSYGESRLRSSSLARIRRMSLQRRCGFDAFLL